ncbi:hypothetical protein MBLNU230_g7962t1 [Neophaeotheca triangularis]
MDPYTFASSSEVHVPVGVKINRLEGFERPLPYSTLLKRPDLRHRGSNLSPHSELYVTVQPFADSKPLTVHSQTPYKHFKNGRTWNQWLSLPVEYSTLPVNTQLAITLWDLSPVDPKGVGQSHHVPFGGTTIPLFGDDATLRTGRHKCRIWRHKAADGFSDTATPFQEPKKRGRRGTHDETVVVSEKHRRRDAELERLVALMKQHEMGEIETSKWLDPMVFRQIEKLERQRIKETSPLQRDRPHQEGLANGEAGSLCAEGDPDHVDGTFFLYIEFPRFDHPIVFTDHEYPPPPVSSIKTPYSQNPNSVSFKPPPEVQLGPGIYGDDTSRPLITIYDPEVGFAENPAETKHRKLSRSQRDGFDRDLRPNPRMRDTLKRIVAYGPTVELNAKEKDDIWKYRHYLSRDKRALTKLVKSVNWNESKEYSQVTALLSKWVEIDVDDALELLGPGVQNPTVRTYAVDRLRKADDEELLLYLLQLVQALKFEPQNDSTKEDDTDSSLASFLVARSAANLKLGNFLHWYIMVELDNDTSKRHKQLFARVSYDFMKELESSPEGQERRKVLQRQGEFVQILTSLTQGVQNTQGDRPSKIDKLKKTLSDPKHHLANLQPPLPLPLNPDIHVTSIIPEELNIFKSSLLPLLLNFSTTTNEQYPFIFKTGDDLRQDQLVVQIIALMNRLLLSENLDLKLTPYSILATSTTAGAVQYIPSTSLSTILSTSHKNAHHYTSILSYLRHHNPANIHAVNNPNPTHNSLLGVRRDAMETYVKSLAGYSVITYLLGVGDRHLDNLLLAPDGRFFHIDFGYILGRDPKPMAPLMKLSREMIDGLGGVGGSESQFANFKRYAFTCYTTLRRSSGLILNLFALMEEAGIQGLSVVGGVGGGAGDAVRRVEERFKLDVSEEEAVAFLDGLIEREMGAWGPRVIDRLHGIAQTWRA